MAKKIEKKDNNIFNIEGTSVPGSSIKELTSPESNRGEPQLGINYEDTNEKLIKEADSVVFKHKLIVALVDQCLKNHKKEHDEVLAEKLYKHFDKELQ